MGDPRFLYERIITVTMNGVKGSKSKQDLLNAFYWTEDGEDDDD